MKSTKSKMEPKIESEIDLTPPENTNFALSIQEYMEMTSTKPVEIRQTLPQKPKPIFCISIIL